MARLSMEFPKEPAVMSTLSSGPHQKKKSVALASFWQSTTRLLTNGHTLVIPNAWPLKNSWESNNPTFITTASTRLQKQSNCKVPLS